MKVIFFGGTFNPPTISHTQIVSYLMSHYPDHLVVVVPAYQNPLKGRCSTHFESRVEMTSVAMRHFSRERCAVSDIEYYVALANDGKAHTYNVVQEYLKNHDNADVKFVIGADCWEQRYQWYKWEKLCKIASPVILGRPGYEVVNTEGAEYIPVMFDSVSSTMIRDAGDNDIILNLYMDPEVLSLWNSARDTRPRLR